MSDFALTRLSSHLPQGFHFLFFCRSTFILVPRQVSGPDPVAEKSTLYTLVRRNSQFRYRFIEDFATQDAAKTARREDAKKMKNSRLADGGC